jgi:hypothetical protein
LWGFDSSTEFMNEIWQLIGFVGGAVLLIGYFVSAHLENPTLFHWANVVASTLMFYPNIYFEAYFGAMVTGTMGCIGLYGLLRRYGVLSSKAWRQQ